MSDYWMSGVVENDAEEARDAARFDDRDLVRISGQYYDAADAPDLADVADLGDAS